MDFSITSEQGVLKWGTMVNGTISFKLSPKDKTSWWSGYLRIQLKKQQSRQHKTREELDIFARLKNGKLTGLLRMFGKLPLDPASFHHIMCREKGLGFVGYYAEGKLVGPSWQGKSIMIMRFDMVIHEIESPRINL